MSALKPHLEFGDKKEIISGHQQNPRSEILNHLRNANYLLDNHFLPEKSKSVPTTLGIPEIVKSSASLSTSNFGERVGIAGVVDIQLSDARRRLEETEVKYHEVTEELAACRIQIQERENTFNNQISEYQKLVANAKLEFTHLSEELYSHHGVLKNQLRKEEERARTFEKELEMIKMQSQDSRSNASELRKTRTQLAQAEARLLENSSQIRLLRMQKQESERVAKSQELRLHSANVALQEANNTLLLTCIELEDKKYKLTELDVLKSITSNNTSLDKDKDIEGTDITKTTTTTTTASSSYLMDEVADKLHLAHESRFNTLRQMVQGESRVLLEGQKVEIDSMRVLLSMREKEYVDILDELEGVRLQLLETQTQINDYEKDRMNLLRHSNFNTVSVSVTSETLTTATTTATATTSSTSNNTSGSYVQQLSDLSSQLMDSKRAVELFGKELMNLEKVVVDKLLALTGRMTQLQQRLDSEQMRRRGGRARQIQKQNNNSEETIEMVPLSIPAPIPLPIPLSIPISLHTSTSSSRSSSLTCIGTSTNEPMTMDLYLDNNNTASSNNNNNNNNSTNNTTVVTDNVAVMRSKLIDTQAELTVKKRSLEELRRSNAEFRRDVEKEIDRYIEEIDNLKLKLKVMEADKEHLEGENNTLSMELKNIQSERVNELEMNGSNKNNSNSNRGDNNDLMDLRVELQEYRESLRDKTNAIACLEREVQTLRVELMEIGEREKALLEIIEGLEEDLSHGSQRETVLKEQLHAKTSLMFDLEDSVKSLVQDGRNKGKDRDRDRGRRRVSWSDQDEATIVMLKQQLSDTRAVLADKVEELMYTHERLSDEIVASETTAMELHRMRSAVTLFVEIQGRIDERFFEAENRVSYECNRLHVVEQCQEEMKKAMVYIRHQQQQHQSPSSSSSTPAVSHSLRNTSSSSSPLQDSHPHSRQLGPGPGSGPVAELEKKIAELQKKVDLEVSISADARSRADHAMSAVTAMDKILIDAERILEKERRLRREAEERNGELTDQLRGNHRRSPSSLSSSSFASLSTQHITS
eukprot:gene78-96_t